MITQPFFVVEGLNIIRPYGNPPGVNRVWRPRLLETLEDHVPLCAFIGQSKFMPRANSWLLMRGEGHILSRVTRHLFVTWQDSRWQRIFAWSFLFKIFPHLCKIPWAQSADRTFLLKDPSWKSFCHRNTRENATDSQHQSWSCACMRLEIKLWMTYHLMSLMVDWI